MFGPETNELVQDCKIATPHPDDITTANFPLGSWPYSDLIVLIPIEKNWGKTVGEVLDELGLKPPEPRHAIRFVSQFKPGEMYQAHQRKNIFFPHEPYISRHIKISNSGMFREDEEKARSSWLVSVWREQQRRPELCLWSCYDRDWKENTKDLVAGVAEHLRVFHELTSEQMERLAFI